MSLGNYHIAAPLPQNNSSCSPFSLFLLNRYSRSSTPGRSSQPTQSWSNPSHEARKFTSVTSEHQSVSGIRLAPLETSDSSGNGAKKKRLTKKRRKPKSTFLTSKIDRFSSDDDTDDVDDDLDANTSKFEDDGFGSYESTSSGRSKMNKVLFYRSQV